MNEARKIFTLAGPLIIGQLGQMLLGVADTVMVAELGVTDLAALTFASLIFYVPLVFGMGLLTCVAIRTANARGADHAETARGVCRNGLYLATAVGVVLLLGSLLLLPFLDHFGQPAEVVERMPGYYVILMVSMVPALMGIGLKNHADAMDHPWPAFWISISGILLNVLLNWVLIFGHLGAPVMGLLGAGWATLIARIAMVVAMLIWFMRSRALKNWVPLKWLRAPDVAEIKRQLAVGGPGALQMVAEVGAFSTAGLLIGRFGAAALAAHQIALTCAATAFMVPLGLSQALTIRMGEAMGGSSHERLKAIMKAGWVLALGFAGGSALLFLFGGQWLASLFIDRADVVAIAASLLAVAGVFQLVDGLQVASGGMLRGMQDVRWPALLGVLCYWLVAIPVAVLLSQNIGLGVTGVWWGLACGLGTAAVVLSVRLWRKVIE